MVEKNLLLQKNDIHLYVSDPHRVRGTRVLTRYRDMLTEEEKKKRARYLFEKDRHRYLVTRAMIRSLLSRYGECEPREWRFSTNEWDKPEICTHQNPHGLRFNISHTDAMICCVFTPELDIGVDVECNAGWLVINTGDMLQECSDGYYPSTIHRVVNPKAKYAHLSRYSIPLFIHPRDEVILSKRYSAKKYLDERLKDIGLKK